MKISILGRGRVGRGLESALTDSAHDVVLTSGRRPSPKALAAPDVVILAIPDGAIRDRALSLAERLPAGTVLLHCAGARGADELAPAAAAGLETGAMHPLVSFAVPGRPPSCVGTTFAIEGTRRAVAKARIIARAAGARPLVAAVHGPAYHASAALVANGAAALASAGVHILLHLGVGRRDAEKALGALLRTVADNVEKVGIPDALTGPIMRGDAGTIEAHRRALRPTKASLAAYDSVAHTILDCALEAGLPEDRAPAIREQLAGQG